MLDSIGLGETIANFIYFAILIVGIIISFLFMLKKKILLGILIVSCTLNLFLFLYFLGRFNQWLAYLIIYIWPIINILLLFFLIFNSIKKRNTNEK